MLYGNVYCESLGRNSIFDFSSPRNSDGLFTPLIMLKEELLKLGIELNTPDMNEGRKIALEIHMDGRPLVNSSIPKYLIAAENPLINLLNADSEYLKNFTRVFSWNDKSLIHQGSVHVLIPNVLSIQNVRSFADRNIFACLISSNKVAPWFGKDDLYAERINVIRWYEKQAPDRFHLYGRGWGKHSHVFSMRAKIIRGVGRLRSKLFGHKAFPSWHGEVNFKAEILSRTKFSYCYENVKDLPNYITEKIFDSFISGCVPVYWGANNVLEHIPKDCFVDRRDFNNTAEVHQYLLSITPEQYAAYQKNIMDFLNSDKAYLFSAEYFAKTIAKVISSDLPAVE